MDKVKQEWCCVSKAMAAHQSWFLDQDQEKKILSESPLTSTSKKKKKREHNTMILLFWALPEYPEQQEQGLSWEA